VHAAFVHGAEGTEFLDEGDEGDDLGGFKVFAELLTLEVLLVREEDA